MSIFAEPKRLIDRDEAADLLTSVLPNVDVKEFAEFVTDKRDAQPRYSSQNRE